jgi:N-acetylglutamate synthase-like GNAT family acetyltransferase
METIRTFEPGYAEQVSGLILSIQQEELGLDLTLEDQPDLKHIEQNYQKDNGNFWVFMDEDQVVGTIGVFDIGNKQCVIRKMFVRKEYRGGGRKIAWRLLDLALQWCRGKQVRDVYLGTADSLRVAIRFYLRNCFEELPKKKLPPGFPVQRVENRFFWMRL